MSNEVEYQREDYKYSLKDWTLVDDVCAGQRKVKEGGESYLPRFTASSDKDEDDKRYKQYKRRAVFHPMTGRTLKVLTGLAFTKKPGLEANSIITDRAQDIDGQGISLEQQSKAVTSEVLKKGRHALLVDYPSVDGGISKAQRDAGLVRGVIISIPAANVINWETVRVGSQHKYSLVVIREREAEKKGEFEAEYKTQYRVLRLTDGIYTVQIYIEKDSGYEPQELVIVKDGRGNSFKEIPFSFVGSENNDQAIDEMPMLDMATLNIAHYHNSADYEDSVFYSGQPQLVITGLTETWADRLEENEILIGSRQPLPLPENSDAKFIQPSPNTLVKEAMDNKVDMMAALGARLLEKGGKVKTATESDHDNRSEHSVLSGVVSNVSAAYTKCLSWLAQFENVPEDSSYSINQEFTEFTLSPEMLGALISAVQSGELPQSDFWQQLRKGGVIDADKEDDQIKQELEESVAGLNLDES